MLKLSEEPQHYPDCCLSLSSTLFRAIASIIHGVAWANQDEIVLTSVGCGSGLFETQLAHCLPEYGLGQCRVQGVEVATAVTKHIPNERVNRVQGTWDLFEGAVTSHALIFVYPREGSLVARYLRMCATTAVVVLWLGPQADWLAQQALLSNIDGFGQPTVAECAGLKSYEVLVVFSNKRPETLHKARLIEPGNLLDTEIELI